MRIGTFGEQGHQWLGALRADSQVVCLDPFLRDRALSGAAALYGVLGDVLESLTRFVDDADDLVPLDGLPVGPPVPRPGKVVVVGANYGSGLATFGGHRPSVPLIHLRPGSCVVGPGTAIRRPAGVGQLDYEGEVAVVIGTGGSRIAVEDAFHHVAGYTVANDITAHDLIGADVARSPMLAQPLRGKGQPTFCPMGPWLVTTDEVPDPQALQVTTTVNGEVRQDSSTADMLFPVAELIADLSRTMHLDPGDVVLTGTPAGVGRDTGRYLSAGDRVQVSVSGLGTLDNYVVEDGDTGA